MTADQTDTSTPRQHVPARGLSRRAFLIDSAGVVVALGALNLYLDPAVAAAVKRGAALVVSEATAAADGIDFASPQITIAAERDSDLMLADFTFYGFSIDKTSDPPKFVAGSSTDWVGVVVRLPPQAIGEAVYPYQPPSDPYLTYDPTPIVSQMSGPSQLAFSFESGATIPLPTMKVADLLDWSGWTLNVQPTATAGITSPTGASLVRAPNANETYIECPLDLILAPVVYPPARINEIIESETTTKFVSAAQPITSSRQVTECWSTSLTGSTRSIVFPIDGVGGGPSLPYEPAVAVVWAWDYDTAAPGDTLPDPSYIEYSEYIAPAK
jgi:hypothetical protein